jgi:hypothetical protein
MTRPFLAAALAALITITTSAQTQPRFTSRTDLVTVSVSVKKGNSPVANLTAADFRLYDNDVAQNIEALTIEAVPLDVTLFMDTSGSTSGALERMQRNIRSMAAMLRPTDRFRLLTIGLSVNEPQTWRPGGPLGALDIQVVPGISVIYDALVAAFAHQPDAGRRHLIVALTDGQDCGSIVDGQRMTEVGARSEAVMHWIYVSSSGDMAPHAIPAFCTPDDAGQTDYVRRAAEQSGGARHQSRFGDPAVRAFSRILADFRQSYILRYSASGVPAKGWHRLRVEVPDRKGVSIAARSGYFGS